ncbi:MAG: sugar ABC transporter substrate-binding protein [Planctomycetota bacterium]|nr:MAG: sugar ABC transporter substrate-binding protein [Planctomycetota bacterium]
MKFRALPLLISLGLPLACGGETEGAADNLRRIAVIPKGTTHEFWKAVQAGAVRAGQESQDVEILWRGPEREDDRAQQVALVESYVSRGVDAMVLAPLDQRALTQPVSLAMGRNIPVVIIDSGLDGEAGKDFLSYVATDNFEGGVRAARHLGQGLPEGGKVLLLRYAEGSESTGQREQGFLDTIRGEFPSIDLVDPKRYAGATRATAQEAAENLLSVHTDLAGVFCPNESSTYGMLLALRSRGLAGKVRFVGFDASEGLVEGLKQGHLHGLVLQNPMQMGYLGVQTALRHLNGERVETRIDTGVRVASQGNMNDPEIQELLHPDFEAVLGG